MKPFQKQHCLSYSIGVLFLGLFYLQCTLIDTFHQWMFSISNKDICLQHTFPWPQRSLCTCGAQANSNMPIKLGLGEILMVVNMENVSQGKSLGREGTKKGKGELHTGKRKRKHINRIKQNIFINFLLLVLFQNTVLSNHLFEVQMIQTDFG